MNCNIKGTVVWAEIMLCCYWTLTFSRSGSSSARAKLLLSITEEAATSKGVEPLMVGHAREIGNQDYFHMTNRDSRFLIRQITNRWQSFLFFQLGFPSSCPCYNMLCFKHIEIVIFSLGIIKSYNLSQFM